MYPSGVGLDQFVVYGAAPLDIVVEIAPFPRKVPSLKQLAFVITASMYIAALTVTAIWKGVPRQALYIGVTV